MTIHLQQTGYQSSPYERPTQKWVCGWAAEGNPCRVGPDGHGRCTAQLQSICAPRKQGDRWQCMRLEPFGGPCPDGPLPDGLCCHPEPEHLPCRPRRSIRARRGRVVWCGVVLSIGVLTALLAGPWQADFISPGPLSAAHAAIGDRGTKQCAQCHEAAHAMDSHPMSWVGAAFASSARDKQSGMCLACHFHGDAHSRAHSLFAHSVDPIRLASMPADELHRAPFASRQAGATGTFACAICHQEHRGRDHRLTEMDDRRCQACHRVQFASFSNGHPEFKPPPSAPGRNGINFDHVSHEESHFGQTPFTCSRCHQQDGRAMAVRPFEQSCAGCHAQGHDDHHGQAIEAQHETLLLLPELAFAADDKVYWPAGPGGAADPEKPLPLLMQLLLAGDSNPEFLQALGDLIDHAKAEPAQWEPANKKQVVHIAAGIKRLLHEMTSADLATRRMRLANALGTAPDNPHVIALSQQLASAAFVLREFGRRCLPLLDDDMAQRDVSAIPQPKVTEVQPPPSTALDPRWYIDAEVPAVSLRPEGHADAFLEQLAEALADSINSRVSTSSKSDDTDPASMLRHRIRSNIHEQWTTKEKGGILYAACLRCHQIERAAEPVIDQRIIAPRPGWHAAARNMQQTGFATFNHQPHVMLLTGDTGCRQCHQSAHPAASQTVAAIAQSNSGILPPQRTLCVTCHTPGRADDNCLMCHTYHFSRP